MKMRMALIGLSILGCTLWFSNAAACGDKFIVGPSGTRLEQPIASTTSARILIYRDVGSDTTSAVRDEQLIVVLKEAGHKPVAAEGTQGLEAAVKGGSFDLILVDYASAEKVRNEVVSSPSHPSIVPVLDRTSRHLLSTAKKEFNVVLNVPATVSSVLRTIDKAMLAR